MIQRIAAIVRADVLIRFRRLSTVVVFLLLSASVMFWIPDPASGKTVMQIGGARVLLNSAAIGMSSASLASIFIGLFGFYVISNALRRDIESRCGFVIASTRMTSLEYLVGKFAGNVVFLTTFILGFMVAAMGMLVVRAEAPLEPLLFMKQYAILVPSTIVFVSVLAVVFESIPLLSGRFGDVFYFFFWAAALGVVINAMTHGVTWARWFDFNGFGYLWEFTQKTWHTNSLSIGQSPFDRSKPPLVISGLHLDGNWLVMRLVSTVMPIPLLGVALFFFHRFDPARIRASAVKGRRGLLEKLNGWTAPLARPMLAFGMRAGARPSLLRAAVADAFLTIGTSPILLLIALGLAIASLATSGKALLTGPVAIALAFVAVAIAEVSCRERRAGTLAFVYATPLVKEKFVAFKLLSAAITSLVVMGIPLIRAIASRPSSALPLLVGLLTIGATATSLGIVSANPKTFIVVFLSVWYVMLNDKGATPSLDFAGINGVATAPVMAGYLIASIALLAIAEAAKRWREV